MIDEYTILHDFQIENNFYCLLNKKGIALFNVKYSTYVKIAQFINHLSQTTYYTVLILVYEYTCEGKTKLNYNGKDKNYY